MFPNNGQIAFVSPLDKYTDDKHFVTNFQPGSVLNIFSKIYEKSFLISKMEHHFSPFISTYRNSFSTEHVLIALLDPLDWNSPCRGEGASHQEVSTRVRQPEELNWASQLKSSD